MNLSSIARIFLIICLALSLDIRQTQGQSKLIDAKIDWAASGSNNHGIAYIYLGDENDLASVKVEVGIAPDSYGLFNQQYVITSLPAGATNDIDNNMLQLDLGDLPTYAHYYIRYTVSLNNGTSQVLELKE